MSGLTYEKAPLALLKLKRSLKGDEPVDSVYVSKSEELRR